MELFYFQEGEELSALPNIPLKMQVTHYKHLLEEPKKHSNIEIYNYLY